MEKELAIGLEMALRLSEMRGLGLSKQRLVEIVFQCSWTVNCTISLTTLFFFANPAMIKQMNLPSTLAIIEMLGMHYSPVLMHLLHLSQYPELYRKSAFGWTLVWPYCYYGLRNLIYFSTHDFSLLELGEKNFILLVGTPLQFLVQYAGIKTSGYFARRLSPKQE